VLTLTEYIWHPESFEVQFAWGPFLILLLIAALMIPLQTSFEEYFFRGYIMQGLGLMTKTRWVPLVFTSVVFGAMHAFNPEVDKMGSIIMIYYIGTGFFLGVITLMDRGLELALGFHAGNNLIGALLVTADWTAFQTESILKDVSDPSAGIDTVLPVFVIYPFFLWLMARKYNWSDWSNRLFGAVDLPKQNLDQS
jgi:membrane protease YdiL (CAAX protease family)